MLEALQSIPIKYGNVTTKGYRTPIVGRGGRLHMVTDVIIQRMEMRSLKTREKQEVECAEGVMASGANTSSAAQLIDRSMRTVNGVGDL